MSETYRCEVKLEQRRMAIKAVIHGRHITAHNKKHNARIIQLIPPLGDLGRMVAHGVVRGAHPQTRDGAGEKAPKDNHVGIARRLVARRDDGVQNRARNHEGDGAEEVGPDVDGLIVQIPQRAEGGAVGIGVGAVARDDELIVAAPGGQVVPEDEEGLFDFAFEGGGGGFYC